MRFGLSLSARGEGKGWGVALATSRTAAPLLKRSPHSVGRRVYRLEAFYRPAVERDHGPAETAGNRDLAQRPPTFADRNHALRRRDDEDVASLPHSRRQRYGEVGVGSAPVRIRKNPDHRPSRSRRA